MKLAATIMLAVCIPQDSGEPFFAFKAGTSWKMSQKGRDGDKTITLRVIRVDGEKRIIDSEEIGGDGGAPKKETLVFHPAGGFILWSEQRGDALKDGMRFYKCGSKKGDTWIARETSGKPMEATHMGVEEVTVPAGTFKNVVHVRFVMGERFIHMYLAPGVGFIRMVRVGKDGAEQDVIELTEFIEGK